MNVKRKCAPGVVYRVRANVHNVYMAKRIVKTVVSRLKRPTYQRTKIKQWREFRELTQDQLAVLVGEYLAERGLAKGYSYATIGRLENGKVRYTQPVMEAIADALRTDVPSLIVRDPTESEDLIALLNKAPADQRRMLSEMVRAAVKTGTSN